MTAGKPGNEENSNRPVQTKLSTWFTEAASWISSSSEHSTDNREG